MAHQSRSARPLLFPNRLCTNRIVVRLDPYGLQMNAQGGRLISFHPLLKWAAGIFLAACILPAPDPLQAQDPLPGVQPVQPVPSPPPADTFNRGRWDYGAQIGYTLEDGLDQHEVSHIQMLIAQPQLGFIVRDFQRFPVRRWEIMDEGILGSAVHPHAAHLLGDAVIFRLEGREHGRCVPFLDFGAGVQRTPLSLHVPEVNGFTQFTPQAGLGLEYFVQPQRALVVEWRTVHMSNANTIPPNMGFNSSMITIGFRWLRR